MKRRVAFRRVARFEFDEAYDWYEKQRPGIGEQFSERVQEVLERIAQALQIYPIALKDVRRAIVRGFPLHSSISCLTQGNPGDRNLSHEA